MNEAVDTDTLRRTGEALYGSLWQSALARDLGITDRSMRRWLAGEHAIAADALGKLQQLVIARKDRLSALSNELAKKSAQSRKKPLAKHPDRS